MKRWLSAVVLIVATGTAGIADAAPYYARTALAGTNWNAANMWSNTSCAAGGPVAGPPTAADDVIICNGKAVTVNIAGAIAGSITIEGGGTATSLTMGGVGTTLSVTNAGGGSGNVVINAPSAGVTKQISVGARSLTVTGSVTIGSATAGASNNNIAQLAITTGTATIGSLNVAGGTVNSIAQATVTTGTLNINGNASIATGTLGRGLMTLTGGTINVNGDLAVSAAASTNTSGDATVAVTNAAGLLNVTGNATVTGGTVNTYDALLQVTVASNVGRGIAIGGNLNINATVAGSSSVTLGTNSRMSVAGNVNNGDTLTVGAGLFTMSTPGTTLTTRNNAIAATTSVTTGTLDARNMVVDSGSLGLSRLLLNGTGTINVQGDLSVTTAASTNDSGDATAEVTNAGGLLNVTGNATVTGGNVNNEDAVLRVTVGSNAGRGITIGGNLTVDTTVAGASAVTLAGGAAPNTAKMTVGGAVTNNDTISISTGEFTVTGGYTQVNRPFTVQTTLTTGTLTVGGVLTNNATETITISTTGIVNANGGFTNSGTFTNSAAGQLFLRGAANTIDGTFTRGTGTVTMNGSVNQNLSGTALFPPTTAGDGFHNFTVNNAAGVTLGSNVVARNVITFTTGEVTTGANVLISELSCATPSVVRTSGHVIGNFQKFIPGGASTCVYQVGSAGAYAQASLVFNGVAVGGGRLIVRTDTPDHPSIGSSGLNSALSVNRYWTLTLTGVTGTVLPAFTNYGATFTFVNPGDLDVGVTTGNFEIRRFSAAVWNNTTVGARTGTTTQATGILALGEFAIGEVAPPTPGSFNAFETTTGAGAITGVIRTKRAGVAFSLDVVAILSGAQQASFTNTVRVDLLGNNTLGVALDGSNCPTSFTVVQTVGTDPTITAGRSTVNFAAVANSWRDVRVRIRFPTGSPTVTSCSTDNFAIRPDAITGFSASHNDRTTAGTATSINSTAFGALVHNAGRPFSFRANAVNGAGSPAITTNYTGAPLATVTACGPGVGFEACTLTQGAMSVTTTFAAGALSTDTAQYSEVGSFGLQLIDDDFASVDASDGSTLVERRIASLVINVGRFVPDNFAVAFNVPVFAPACTGFTYQGQLFNYSIAPVITLTAREAGGATTALYAGNWWRLTASTLTPVTQAARYTAASGTLNLGNLPAVTADPAVRYNGDALPSPPVAGTGTLTFSSGTGLSFTRNNAAPSAEFDAEIALSVNVIDADNVTYASNPAAFGAASAGNGIQFGNGSAGTKRVRYGRLRMGSASGSQLLAMRIPVEAQYWNGSVFVTNILDSCTTLLATNVGLGNFGGSLNTGETTASIVNSPLQSGRSAIRLSAPGAANAGSADVTLNLGPTGDTNADACAGFAPAAVAGNLSHLRGLWCNPPNTYTKDPSVRARFGINRGTDQSIYRREQ